jgi:hypothetical protein
MPTATAVENLNQLAIPQLHPTPKFTPPALVWITGKIKQILNQDKEHFYVLSVNDGKKSVIVRFGDPYTGNCDALTTANPMYSLMEKAFFANMTVEIGYRDFGYDAQAGIEKFIIDRVFVYQP